MADRFFDTSAFAKHYRSEVGTGKVDAFLAETGSGHFISVLGVVELHSVLARLVREGQITAADFHLARGRFLADIASGLWQVLPVTGAQFHHAQQLLVRHGLGRSLRTLDALQLAASLLNTARPLDAFVCADRNVCLVAAAEGLTVVNPESP
ncbi:MAG: type II toxin-antitoxin system VapC family toxin [Thermoguttaceae bacterium]